MLRSVPPWQASLTSTERAMVTYALAVAGLALLAMLVRTVLVRGEVSARYRPAVIASIGVLSVAFLSYVVLVVEFHGGYRRSGAGWTPTSDAVWAWAARYMDWSVSVPLLVVELVAVSSLRGRAVVRTRLLGAGTAFAMIATGYIGGVAVDDGGSFAALAVWGGISSVFFIALYVLVLLTVLRSLPALPSAARRTYSTAMVVLMVTWFVYPVVFGLQGVTSGGGWATTGQLLLSAADVAAKVGFGLLIHRVAKLRTAFDVQAGLDTHPEGLWMDGSRLSDALYPSTPGPILLEVATDGSAADPSPRR